MNKLFFFDVETTGVNPDTSEIHQLSYIIEIDGAVAIEADYRIKPSPRALDMADPKALEMCGVTMQQLESYPTAHEVKKLVDRDFISVVDKYDRLDKMYPVAYNGNFDLTFLAKFFVSLNDKYLGSYIKMGGLLDPLAYLRYYTYANNSNLFTDLKLETVCDALNIEIKAHDALSDIRATRDVFYKTLSKEIVPNEPAISDSTDGDSRLDNLLAAAVKRNQGG